MGITVDVFDATDTSAAERAYDIVVASAAAVSDIPVCRHGFLVNLRHPWPGHRRRQALATLDGEPVGYLGVDLPEVDNTHSVKVVLHVHPAYRRRGVGRALHRHLLDLVRAERRSTVWAESLAPLADDATATAPGHAFAVAVGAEAALTEVRGRLDVTAVDQHHLDRLVDSARPHADGYSVVTWRGAVPEELVADLAELDSRFLAEAPTGDLDVEPEPRTPAQIRAIEDAQRLRGRTSYHAGARHDATGRLVGWTMIDFGATTGWHAFQQITLVDRAHRGHRLGLLAKIANLRAALTDRPDWRVVDTVNATGNSHMLAINDALGFRPLNRLVDWQLTV